MDDVVKEKKAHQFSLYQLIDKKLSFCETFCTQNCKQNTNSINLYITYNILTKTTLRLKEQGLKTAQFSLINDENSEVLAIILVTSPQFEEIEQICKQQTDLKKNFVILSLCENANSKLNLLQILNGLEKSSNIFIIEDSEILKLRQLIECDAISMNSDATQSSESDQKVFQLFENLEKTIFTTLKLEKQQSQNQEKSFNFDRFLQKVESEYDNLNLETFDKHLDADFKRRIFPKQGFGLLREALIKRIFSKYQNQLKNSKLSGDAYVTQEEEIDEQDQYDAYQDALEQKIVKTVQEQLQLSSNISNQPEQKPQIGFGQLIIQKMLRQTENTLAKIIDSFYINPKSEELRTKKIFIIAQSNKRADQISQIEESGNKNFRFKKFLATQKQKKQDKISFEQEIKNYDIFLMLPKKLLSLLKHGELPIEYIDLLVIDEANLFPKHTVNQIMVQFYYNHVTPQNPITLNDGTIKSPQRRPLPYVLGFLSLDSIISENDLSKIYEKLKMLCNILNTKLCTFNTQESQLVMQQYLKQLHKIDFSKVDPVEILKQYDKVKEFMKIFNKFISISDDLKKKALQIQPSPDIFDLKRLEEIFFFTTKRQGPFTAESYLQTEIGAKCCHQDSLEFLENIGAKTKEILDDLGIIEPKQSNEVQESSNNAAQLNEQISQQLQNSKAPTKKQGKNAAGNTPTIFKPDIITIQYVENKVRYYTSKLKIDWVLRPLFCIAEQYQDEKEISFYSENCLLPNLPEDYKCEKCKNLVQKKFTCQNCNHPVPEQYQCPPSLAGETIILLKKKLEVESWVMFEACKKLSKLSFFDSFLRPDKTNIYQAIVHYFGLQTPEQPIIATNQENNSELTSIKSEEPIPASSSEQQVEKQLPNIEQAESTIGNQSTIDQTQDSDATIQPTTTTGEEEKEEIKISDDDYSSDDSVDTYLTTLMHEQVGKTDYQLTQACEEIAFKNQVKIQVNNDDTKDKTDILLKYVGLMDEYQNTEGPQLFRFKEFYQTYFPYIEIDEQPRIDEQINQIMIFNEQMKKSKMKRSIQKYSDIYNFLVIKQQIPKNISDFASQQWELNKLKLKIIIKTILNPILKATQIYTNLIINNKALEDKQEDELIKWKETEDCKEYKKQFFKVVIINVNQGIEEKEFFKYRPFVKDFVNKNLSVFGQYLQIQISKSYTYITVIYDKQEKMHELVYLVNQIKALDDKEHFIAMPLHCVKQKNPTIIHFEEYCKQILLPELLRNQDLDENQEINELCQLIDKAADKLFLPNVFNQHQCESVHKSRNRYNLLLMLCISLASKPAKSQKLEDIKDEQARLAFIGDSSITLAVVFHCIQYLPTNYNEKDMDAFKMKNIKSENIKIKGIKSGLSMLLMKEDGAIEGDFRSIEEVYQSFAGFLTLYIGFDACLMFLYDTGLLKLDDRWFSYQNVSQKVALLKDISCKRLQLINHHSTHKDYITKKIKENASSLMAPKSNPWTINQCLDLTHRGTSNLVSRIQWAMLEEVDFNQESKFENCKVCKRINEEAKFEKWSEHQSESSKSTQASSKNGESETSQHKVIQQQQDEQSDQGQQKTTQELYYKIIQQEERNKNKQKPKVSTCGEDLDQIDDKMSEAFEQQSEFKSKQNANFTVSSEITDPYIEGFKTYEFKHEYLLLQAFTHKTFAEKLFKKILSGREVPTIFKDYQVTAGLFGEVQQTVSTMKTELDIIAEELYHFNYQRLEYLGDSILNYTLAKLFYFETMESSELWHQDYYSAMKLHDLKTFFTSNFWLGYSIYEHFFFTQDKDKRKDYYKFFKEAKKKGQDVTKIKIPFNIPYVPLLYDDSNSHFDNQLKSYQDMLFRIFSSTDRNKNKQMLTLKAFKFTDDPDKDNDDIDFAQIQERFIKYLSDVMEAIIGAIFQDSGNLSKTENAVLRLLSSRFTKEFPLKEHERTKVLNVWNSKKYAQPIKLTHSIEEKNDDTYFRAYFSNLEVRRVKFSKDHKKKVSKFYFVVMRYLELAYYKFELSEALAEKKSGLSPQQWLDFNRSFRREYDKIDKPKQIEGKSTCPVFNQLSKVSLTINTKDIQLPRDQLSQTFSRFEQEEKFKDKNEEKFDTKLIILELENERVKNSRVREIFNRAEIKSLTSDRPDISALQFIKNLSERQALKLFSGLQLFGTQLINEIRINVQQNFETLSEAGSNSYTITTTSTASSLSNQLNHQSTTFNIRSAITETRPLPVNHIESQGKIDGSDQSQFSANLQQSS